jgi:renal tumor antigen
MLTRLLIYLPQQVNGLREIQAIKRLSPHRNIIVLEEVLFDPPSGRLALVFELMEGNLYELMKGKSRVNTNVQNDQ